jgi:hypothetical protein
MKKEQFVKRLRAIGEIPVPTGHARRNKGVTSFFFSPDKAEELDTILSEHVGTPVPAEHYAEGTQWYKDFPSLAEHPEPWLGKRTKSVLLHPTTDLNDFLVVSVCIWD